VIEQLNEALLAKATEAKLLRVGRVRGETTVLSAKVDYPARSPRSCGYAGAQARGEAQRVVAQATAALARLAETSAADAQRCCVTPAVPCAPPPAAAPGNCAVRSTSWLPRSRPPPSWRPKPARGWPGVMPDAATRVVSLHDRDARPIVRGRLDRPVEFGYKAQICDNDDG